MAQATNPSLHGSSCSFVVNLECCSNISRAQASFAGAEPLKLCQDFSNCLRPRSTILNTLNLLFSQQNSTLAFKNQQNHQPHPQYALSLQLQKAYDYQHAYSQQQPAFSLPYGNSRVCEPIQSVAISSLCLTQQHQ